MAFHAAGNRLPCETVMSPLLKRVIGLLVIYGILYVLISPLPELDAAFSGKTAVILFVFIGYALVALLIPAVASQRYVGPYSSFSDVLNRTCARLC
jgi:hypothetical protein